MLTRVLLSFLALAMLLFTVGCGGSGGDSGDPSPAGIYQAAFTRATGDIVFGIAADGKVDVTISDSTAGTFAGTGTLSQSKTFTITATNSMGGSAVVNGTVSGTGSGRRVTGTVSGAITMTFNAAYRQAPSLTSFVHSYSGTITGTVPGTITGTVDSTGHFAGNFQVTEGDVIPLSGTVQNTGAVLITGTHFSSTFTFTGNLRFGTGSTILASGKWTSNTELADHGDWQFSSVVLN